MIWEELTIREEFTKLFKKLMKLNKQVDEINKAITRLQFRCPHPGDKITVVSSIDGTKDYTSCNDCGKLFE